jgi:hypothetical protein
LTSVLSLLFLRGPFLTFIDNSGASISLTISGAVISGNEKIATYIILPVLAVIVPLMAVVIILLFRKRQLQIKLTGILVAMEIGFIAASAICVLLILSKNDASIASWSKPLIPLVQIVLTLLALRAIRKDEDLVKSYDRIR